MDTSAQLRRQPRDIRDQAIAEAREAYANRLTRIVALEQELAGARQTKEKRLTHAIDAVIPKDQPFTTLDVYAGLEALDERRSYRKSWVISHLGKLCERGIIRRVQKNHGRQNAIYGRVGVKVDPTSFEQQTLPMAVDEILRGHGAPLLPAEIAVRLREREFRTEMDYDKLRSAVAACCRARPERSRRVGAKWGVA